MSLLMDALKKAEQAKKSTAPEDPPSNFSDTLLTEWNDTVSFPPDSKELPPSVTSTSQTPPVEDNFVYTKEWWKTQSPENDKTSQLATSELEDPASAKTAWQSDLLTDFKDDSAPSPASLTSNESTVTSASVNWNEHRFLQDSFDTDNSEAGPAWSATSEPLSEVPAMVTTVDYLESPKETVDKEIVDKEETVDTVDKLETVPDTTPGENFNKIQGFSLREWQHEKSTANSTTVASTEGEYLFGPSPLELDLHSATSEAREGVESPSTTRRVFTQTASRTEPEAAQRLFAAGVTPTASRTKIFYALIGVVLIGLGTGGYYYYTLTSASLFLGKTPSQPFKLSDKLVPHNTPPKGIHITKETKTVGSQPQSANLSSPPPTPVTETATSTSSPQKVTNQSSEPTVSEVTSPLLSANPIRVLADAKPLIAEINQQREMGSSTTVAKSAETPKEEAPKRVLEPKPTRSSESPPAATTKPSKTESQPPQSKTPEPLTTSESKVQSATDLQPRLKKSLSQQVNQDIATAYAAFQRGDAKTAEQIYTRALQQDQTNHDALLGLAAVAVRRGDMPAAQQYYRLLLKFYPQDTYAQVGLLNTLDNRSSDNESQLKLLLEKAPRSAYIYFSLGNLYANQERWAQAQQAYFEAYRYDSNKADYAYNLAVSLDQLNQSKTALNYYQTALALGRTQVVSFNLQAIQQRVQTLLKHQ